MSKELKEGSNTDWVCRDCHYRIAGLTFSLLKEDYGCPRCGNTFIRFDRVEPIIKNEHRANT